MCAGFGGWWLRMYMEMMTQFGFVALFAAAFPAARPKLEGSSQCLFDGTPF